MRLSLFKHSIDYHIITFDHFSAKIKFQNISVQCQEIYFGCEQMKIVSVTMVETPQSGHWDRRRRENGGMS